MSSLLQLTTDELMLAICNDLTQYPPQLQLLPGLLRVITGDPAHLRMDTHRGGAWIRSGNNRPPFWLDASALVGYACEQLVTAELSGNQWRDLAGRVFQTPCRIGSDLATGKTAVLIDTGMEQFQCRQCGRCCQCLDYRYGVTDMDIQRWKKEGRDDILCRVAKGIDGAGNRRWRIWMDPLTGQRVNGCPFLSPSTDGSRWGCGIHATKPALCREYPMTQKHAHMTGCPGIR